MGASGHQPSVRLRQVESVSHAAERASSALRDAQQFRPVVRLCNRSLLVANGTDVQERCLPTIQLAFEYEGVRLRLSDEREGFFVSEAGGLTQVARDRGKERQAQCVLEGFGAVELSCLQDVSADSETEASADYLVSMSDSSHALCSFSAYAVPQLRRMGWLVEIEPDYAYQVVDQSPWYASLDGDDESDWFSLELGVEVDGERVNLLPRLLGVLESTSDSESLSSLFRAPARFRALQVAENTYAVIPPERLRRLLFMLEQFYEGNGKDLKIRKAEAPAVCELSEAFADADEELSWTGPEDVLRRGRSLRKQSPAPHVGVAAGLTATLRPYQQDGLNWLQQLRCDGVGGVLADDMGLGKTLQTIAHLAKEKESGRMDLPCLVVVPKSLIVNWKRELKKFAPFLKSVAIQGAKRRALYPSMAKHDVIITTYPVVVRDVEHFRALEYHVLILDEAQAIKNTRSLSNRAVNTLEARHRLCLTGTPVENNLAELWALFDFLNPGYLGSQPQFRTRYQIPIERDRDDSRLEQLRSRVASCILRRMKHTVAKDLPPKTEITRAVDLGGEQRDLYEAIRLAAHAEVRQVIRKRGLSGSTIAILDALMKLRQACCDPRLVRSESARHVKQSAKFELLMELISSLLCAGHRILVFSQFTRMLSLISAGLTEKNVAHIALTGATQDRQEKCDAFEAGKADVFLLSLKAAGTGLNLVSADTVIHYDPWWNPTAQAQATDRAYRIGQQRPVFVYNLIVAGSVEERMLRLQSQKRHLADTILGHKTQGTLDERDVDDLFDPLED